MMSWPKKTAQLQTRTFTAGFVMPSTGRVTCPATPQYSTSSLQWCTTMLRLSQPQTPAAACSVVLSFCLHVTLESRDLPIQAHVHAVARQATLEHVSEAAVRTRLKDQAFHGPYPIDWLCCGPHANEIHPAVASLSRVTFTAKHGQSSRAKFDPGLLDRVVKEVQQLKAYSNVHTVLNSVHSKASDVSKSDIQACLEVLKKKGQLA